MRVKEYKVSVINWEGGTSEGLFVQILLRAPFSSEDKDVPFVQE